MPSRVKPYNTNQESWGMILRKSFQIPMNQRGYEWEDYEIDKYVNDILFVYEEDKYIERMGNIIILESNGNYEIYDGQQRTLTTALIIHSLGYLSNELKEENKSLLYASGITYKLSAYQTQIKNELNANYMPKITCVNPNDMKSLVNIFNDRVVSHLDYVYNIEEIEWEKMIDGNVTYKCKLCFENNCENEFTNKINFIKHIVKHHGYNEYNGQEYDSKLYNAFLYIYNKLKLISYTNDKLIELYKFILEHTDIQFYKCYDPVYVSRIFDRENNRGKAIKPLDLIKNSILVHIQDKKKIEVYDIWQELQKKEFTVYKKNGPKIYNIAIQIYNGMIKRTNSIEQEYETIYNNNNNSDVYSKITSLFEIIRKLHQIMDDISNDKFGRLINYKNNICLAWEGYMFCMLPIFYHKGSIDKKLIKLFTKWFYRNNFVVKTRNFNNLAYSNEFISITNEYLSDENKTYDYYKQLKQCLQKNKDELVLKDNFINNLAEKPLTSINATAILLFLETCITTDIHIVPLTYTLEHIYSQKNKDELTQSRLLNVIGNLTLLEGKNSDESKHKGNSSLKAKSYQDKKISYKTSSSQITKNILEHHKDKYFTEDDIIKRSKELAKMLEQYSNY